ACGFERPEEAARHLLQLSELEAFRDRAEAVIASAIAAADPGAALLGLLRYAEACGEKQGHPFGFESAKLDLLAPVLGASGFLTNYLTMNPGALDALADSPWLAREKTEEALRGEFDNAEGADSFELLQRVLRRVRAAEMLRIATRDLTGRADVETVMRELSLLAECALDVAAAGCEAQLRRRYGVPRVETVGGEILEGEFAVIGLGKLGARELNFSSDVDLIYVYSSSRGQTAGGEDGETLGLHAYYVRLSEMVTRAIGELTQDGLVFRVDLNLRPDGSRGQLANSLMASEVYYASWGETWERSALLRARPVAGNRRLGGEFLRMIAPIIYRKTLDMGTLEDMRQMKRRIDAESRRITEGAWNVKLGKGGIREIEFLVSALQLVHAGRNRTLQISDTLLCLDRLQEAGLLEPEEAAGLAEAYRFFRALEHRLQMAEDRQTHLLPARQEDRDRVVRAMGFAAEGCRADHDGFVEVLGGHRRRVSDAFKRVLATREAEAPEEEIDPAVQALIDLDLPPEEETSRLAALGFEDPENAAARLVWLRDPPSEAGLSVRSRRLLRGHAPVFLQEIVRSPDPDRALAHVERFFSSTQARYTLFTVLAAHRETFRVLIRLFGMSDYLSDDFIQHPELLDSLVLASYATVRKTRTEIEQELETALSDSPNLEAWLDNMRRFKRGEILRIAFNDLSGTLTRSEVNEQLSSLADACLSVVLNMGRRELDARYGPPTDPEHPGEVARFALIGLGKLGGREIDYHSDLDIIFVFDPQGETAGGPQGRAITNFEYFVKLAQRIIVNMTLRTAEGGFYEIDTRLRPSGNAGTLVTSLEGFERHHARSAQIWERQALIRARFVAGDAELGARLEARARRFVYEEPWERKDRDEIARIRLRMEKEIAREKPGQYNVKTGRGGLVDVEFIAQALQLEHGRGKPGIQVQNTLAALAALREAGCIPPEEGSDLAEGYRFLRTLESYEKALGDNT
ncbi:MAG: bifunctional [glutamate--ammonia ligase]-adenylyl-L-tyrosine phosphorylase/[glutamate--ammonia-ligase] adenylyltransferase, partial [Myxococcota bacterium]